MIKAGVFDRKAGSRPGNSRRSRPGSTSHDAFKGLAPRRSRDKSDVSGAT
jgi:hypothetical protein